MTKARIKRIAISRHLESVSFNQKKSLIGENMSFTRGEGSNGIPHVSLRTIDNTNIFRMIPKYFIPIENNQ